MGFFCFSTCWTKIPLATTRLGCHHHDSPTENSVLCVDILLRQQNILHSFNKFFFFLLIFAISLMLNILVCLMLCLFSNKSIFMLWKKEAYCFVGVTVSWSVFRSINVLTSEPPAGQVSNLLYSYRYILTSRWPLLILKLRVKLLLKLNS